jgi:hypothetical protein
MRAFIGIRKDNRGDAVEYVQSLRRSGRLDQNKSALPESDVTRFEQ